MKNAGKWKRSGVFGITLTLLLLGGCKSTKDTGFAYGALNTAFHQQSEMTDIFGIEDGAGGLQIAEQDLHLNIGDSLKLEPVFDIQDNSVYRLCYSSSDEAVCTVMRDGTIQGNKAGTAVITVQEAFSGAKVDVAVTVDDQTRPAQITLSKERITLVMGNSITIQAAVMPEEAENKKITWSSSNADIATVNENGTVTGVSSGTCVITAASQADEAVQAELQVTVIERTEDNSGNTSNTNDNSGNNSNTGNNNSSNNNNAENSTEAAEPSSSGYYVDSYAEQVLSIVNARREEAGLAPLTMNYTLVSAAKVRAAETIQSFSHTRPNGTSCFSAIDEAGVGYSGAGENIAAGQGSADSVMNAWMNSEGHKANILNDSYSQIGIACYYDPNSAYGYYWVQLFIY